MPFRRKGRPSFYFQGRTETGRVQVCAGTSSKPLATRIEGMWSALALEHRAWDVLGRVLAGELEIGALYDRWVESRYAIAELRRRLEDMDLSEHVAPFLEVYRRGVAEDTADHAEAHLDALFGTEERDGETYLKPLMRSQVTTALLTERLFAYVGKRNTLRKVHSNWSVFFTYLTDVKLLFDANPMNRVERPEVERSPIRFYELEAVQRIVDAQPTRERRALMAIQYGTPSDVSTTLNLTRADVWVATKEIRAAGTKAHTRDRVVRVADWAWPVIAEYVADMLPTARLFPAEWNRWTVSDWHRETVKALGLPTYPLRNARDHWSVRMLRAGAPVAVVQHALGHGSPMLTLTKYGRFIPTGADRDRWEKLAAKNDRLSAKASAKSRGASGGAA